MCTKYDYVAVNKCDSLSDVPCLPFTLFQKPIKVLSSALLLVARSRCFVIYDRNFPLYMNSIKW
jgi:hypothetical protein